MIYNHNHTHPYSTCIIATLNERSYVVLGEKEGRKKKKERKSIRMASGNVLCVVTLLVLSSTTNSFDGIIYHYSPSPGEQPLYLLRLSHLTDEQLRLQAVLRFCEEMGMEEECEEFATFVEHTAGTVIGGAESDPHHITGSLMTVSQSLLAANWPTLAAANGALAAELAVSTADCHWDLMQDVLETAAKTNMEAGETVAAFSFYQELFKARHKMPPNLQCGDAESGGSCNSPPPEGFLIPTGRGLSPPKIARHRLRHDIEQMEHILRRKFPAAATASGEGQGVALVRAGGTQAVSHHVVEATLSIYRRLLKQSPPFEETEQTWEAALKDGFHLPASDWDSIHHWYNRAAVVLDGGRSLSERTSVLNEGVDSKQVEAEFKASSASIVVVDDLLSKRALAEMLDIVHTNTVWYDTKGGYLGAYKNQGFAPKLGAEIAVALKKMFPSIICQHNLTQFWAYKYDPSMKAGTQTHADAAAVNINVWLTETPPQKPLDGMIVYTAKPPAAWTFADYNGAIGKQKRDDLLKSSAYENVTVPYLQNRATIFDSQYFHKTGDTGGFPPGYTNRRINLTFLFGKRGDTCGVPKKVPSKSEAPRKKKTKKKKKKKRTKDAKKKVQQRTEL